MPKAKKMSVKEFEGEWRRIKKESDKIIKELPKQDTKTDDMMLMDQLVTLAKLLGVVLLTSILLTILYIVVN